MQRQITPPQTTRTIDNTEAVNIIASTSENTNAATPVQPPSLPTNTTIVSAFEDLKRYIHDAIKNFHIGFRQLDERLTAIEANKRKRHKKPKQNPPPQSLEDPAESTWDDGDSSVLST